MNLSFLVGALLSLSLSLSHLNTPSFLIIVVMSFGKATLGASGLSVAIN